MKRTNKIVMLLAIFVIAAFSVAQADVIKKETAPQAGSAVVDWSQLGASGATIPHGFAVLADSGNSVFGTFAGASANKGKVAVQGSSACSTCWHGNFTPGEFLINTTSHGPLTFVFDEGLHDVGAYIQRATTGSFTATLAVYNGTQLLGTVTETGLSNNHNDGSAIFIGAADLTSPNITKAVFSITGTGGTNFALGTMYLSLPSPEPGTIVLLGTGLIGLASIVRRRTRT